MKSLFSIALLAGLCTPALLSVPVECTGEISDTRTIAASTKLYFFPNYEGLQHFLNQQPKLQYWSKEGFTNTLAKRLAGLSYSEQEINKAISSKILAFTTARKITGKFTIQPHLVLLLQDYADKEQEARACAMRMYGQDWELHVGF